MRKTLLILAAVAVIAAGAYGYYRYTQKPVAPTITTARITRGDIAETVGATGHAAGRDDRAGRHAGVGHHPAN